MGENPLFSQTPIGVLVLDHEKRILHANPACARAFGRSPKRLSSSGFLDLIQPSDRSHAEEHLNRILAGEIVEWRGRIRRGDGLPRLQSFRGVPLLEAEREERLLLFVSVGEEEGSGRPEFQQLQSFIETLPGQFILTTDRAGRVRYASGLERTHFLDSTSLLGANYQVLLGGERAGGESLDDLLNTVGAGRPWAGLQWHRRKDGPSFPARVFAAPHRDPKSGHTLGAMVVGRDDTPTHRWRDRAERAEPLAQIGSLSTGIAKKISEALSRLEETVTRLGLPAGEATEDAERIGAGISHFRRFLEAVAEFGNRGTLRRQPLPFPEILGEVLGGFEDRMRAIGLQPVTDFQRDLSPVYADRTYLTRILEILLENALDAAEGTPEPVLHLELSNGKEGVILRVTNSSPPLPPEWLDEVLDPFFTTKEGRPGLGLAVAQGMVRTHDGRLWAEMPEPGRLRLTVEMPREAPDRVRDYRPVALNLARPKRILLVGDEEEGRKVTRGFLEKLGYDVHEAWSGRSALAQITNGQLPELVVADFKVSDDSGSWFLGELARLYPRLLPRTVLLAEDPGFETSEKLSMETGCPLVRKPIQPQALLEVLDWVATSS